MSYSLIFENIIPGLKEEKERQRVEAINKILKYASVKRKHRFKIDTLFLKQNNIKLSILEISYLLIDNRIIKVVKRKKNYLILKATQEGIKILNNDSIDSIIIIPKHITRVKLLISNFFKVSLPPVFSFFSSLDNIIKRIMTSGVIKLVVFITSIILFIIKWDEISKFIKSLFDK